MIIYMISDNNGNLLLVGSPEIKIPERMFFMAKNGKVREAPTTTKSGALSMRGGVRSINLIPDGDKVEVFKLGETLEEFRKRQSKKESNDLLNEMMNTKISKKIEMPEMPVKKISELEPEPKVKKEERIIILDDIKKLQDEYKNASRNEKAKLTKQINEKKKKLKELDDKHDEYYNKISKIKNNFSELLRNEYSENNYSIEELKEKYKNVINDIDNIINEMKKQNINSSMEMDRLKKSKIIYMDTIDRLKNRRGKEEEKKVNDTDLINELKQLEKEYYNYYDTIELKKTVSGKKQVSMAGRESPLSIKSKYDTINKKIKNKQPELLSADEYKKEMKKEEKRQKEEDKRKEEIEKVRQEEMRKNSPPTEKFGFINGKPLYKKKTVGAV